ncbi:hypothetical protein NM688_g8801 [Phlebia brevispora]|uniref:Uncharacterized protein n=1 Tax=Phlebia brevispora TaxID=194682 RepID=A0ACC1RMT6_9APHY|nr:hypothetical protein NM688_g8801 [Phlebia brevispora]
MSAGTLPGLAVGRRLVHSGYIGTIRYVGPVNGTQGTWLGVEWDDPKRGKHDGVKDGRRYFTCLIPGSGSFIRPSSAVSLGTSFLKALIAKYVEIPHGPGMETVILGSSRGVIEVEAVRLDKIRGNLSRVERLREVSLDNERVATVDDPDEIRKACPGVRGLDLSKSLLPSWDVVALIVDQLPNLERLTLNWNRLEMPMDITQFRHAFARLKELQISATLISWQDARMLLHFMPGLQLLETGYNRIDSLSTDAARENDDARKENSELSVINFDGNELSDWTATCEALRVFSGLRRLVLSSNHLTVIDEIADPQSTPFKALRHLALASNLLKSWTDIDRVQRWCPALESLVVTGNPLLENSETGPHARQFIIARVPTLIALDAATITPKERTDCELFYMSWIAKHGPVDEDAKVREHPRWEELCEKYGRPYSLAREEQEKRRHDTLENRLIRAPKFVSPLIRPRPSDLISPCVVLPRNHRTPVQEVTLGGAKCRARCGYHIVLEGAPIHANTHVPRAARKIIQNSAGAAGFDEDMAENASRRSLGDR